MHDEIKQYNRPKSISDIAVRRLSSYLRTLNILEENGVDVVSSHMLANIEGVGDGLVRRDLTLFGSFGTRGVGYYVTYLKEQIIKILGLDRKWNIVLIGTGEISRVFLHSDAFKKKNFHITKIFNDLSVNIGRKIEGLIISDIDNLENEIDPGIVDLAIVAVPPPKVQSIIDRLGKIGVKGAIYFASRSVNIPKNMIVRNQDISIEIGILTYHITKAAFD